MEAQDRGMEPTEVAIESELDFEDLEDSSEGTPSAMPWLLPILAIVSFFAFVVLLVIFIL